MANPTDKLIRKTYMDETDRMVRGALLGTRESRSVKERVAQRLNLTPERVHDGVARTVRRGA